MKVRRSKRKIFGGIDGLRIELRLQNGEFIGSYDQYLTMEELNKAPKSAAARVGWFAQAMYEALEKHIDYQRLRQLKGE